MWICIAHQHQKASNTLYTSVRVFDWYRYRRPWMTLNGYYAVCGRKHAFIKSIRKK